MHVVWLHLGLRSVKINKDHIGKALQFLTVITKALQKHGGHLSTYFQNSVRSFGHGWNG